MNAFALWLLSSAVGPADRDAVTGDLVEESSLQDRTWLWRQVLCSIPPALLTRWRRGQLQEPLLASVLLVSVPFRLLDLLWTFVLTSVPLRAPFHWPIEFAATNLIAVSVGAFITGRVAAAFEAAPVISGWSLLTVAIVLASSSGPASAWFAAATLGCVAIAVFLGGLKKRSGA